MSVVADIAASYRGPRRVVARLLQDGPREERALVMLLGSCVLVFVAQWPRLAREAHLAGQDLNPILGGSLMAWVFLAPLLFYVLASISAVLARLIRRPVGGYGARLALFWAWLAAVPLILLHGLVAGFVGPGPGLSLVGALWLAAFLWFWASGLIAARENT